MGTLETAYARGYALHTARLYVSPKPDFYPEGIMNL